MTTKIEQKAGRRLDVGAENPTVTVSTVECIELHCELRSDPPTESELEVDASSGRFLVDIVNARDCTMVTDIDWRIRGTNNGGNLDAGQRATHEMGIDESELLDLYFDDCFYPKGHEKKPDPKTPRVTIKLVKKGIG